MKYKKVLAVICVLSVIVVCFVLPASASLVTNEGDEYTHVRYEIIAHNPEYSSVGIFTFPSSVGALTNLASPPFSFVSTTGSGRGFSIRIPNSQNFLDVRLASPVAFPMNDGSDSLSGDKFIYDSDYWEAIADYVVEFPDGSYQQGTYEYRNGVTAPDGSQIASPLVSHVRDYLQYLYPTATQGYVLSLELTGMSIYVADEASIFYETDNIYRHLTSSDLQSTVFDGNVGVADLLIGSLEPFFSFELFPGFTVGGVCAIVFGFGLLFVVLKLFAGG